MGIFDFFKKRNNGGTTSSSNTAPSKAFEAKPSKHSEQLPPPNRNKLIYSLNDLISMRIGADVMLVPYDAPRYSQIGETEAQILSLMVDDSIKRYLPGMDFSTQESAQKFLSTLPFKVEVGLSIAYAITVQNATVGFIFIDTPTFNAKAIGLDKWTLTFFLLPPMRGTGIMSASLGRILYLLKTKLGVTEVYATTDKTNKASQKTLESVFFEPADIHDVADQGVTYVCNLETLNFQHN